MNGNFLLELVLDVGFFAAELDFEPSEVLRFESLSFVFLLFFGSSRSERRSRDLDLVRERRRLSRLGLRLMRLLLSKCHIYNKRLVN